MQFKTIFKFMFPPALALTMISIGQAHQQAGDPSSAAPGLVAIIAAVERGWETADGTPFRAHFLDFEGARYIENGGQNEGLADLINHHVEPEGDSLDNLELNFTDIETHVEGDFAWAIAATEISATVKRDARQIHKRGYQTFLFRRVGSDWKVVHTHSSSRPVKDD
jgi:hypothetical protein|tara:strand:+ start:1809 stop:2306 length:498 start_codon:yes stop_codon:yes gene_type:complete